MTDRRGDAGRPAGARAIVAACFVASGAAALLYEVVWLRLLSYAFGTTAHASAVVHFTLLGGIALGAVLLGRVADRVERPLRVYAALELGIAAWCAATPVIFGAVDAASRHGLGSATGPIGPQVLAQLAVASAVLLPPSVLMGMTLPLLARWVAETGEPAGAGVGRLYALNTWGGVVGTVCAGFWLIPAVGLRATAWTGALVDVAAAGAALLLDRAVPAVRVLSAGAGPVAGEHGRGSRVILVSAAVSGAAAMVLEVAWVRALAPVLSSSTYAFSSMLATFLVGIAGGAWGVARAVRRRVPGAFEVGVVQALAGVAALAALPFFALLPAAVVRALSWLGPSFGSALAVQLGASFAVMIVPALLVGATLPLATAAWVRHPRAVGADVGVVYGANGIGTALGAASAGLLFVPWLGTQHAVTAAAAVEVVVGAAAILVGAAGRTRGLVWAAGLVQVAGLLALSPEWDRRVMTSGAGIYAGQFAGRGEAVDALRKRTLSRTVLFHEEGPHSTVVVFDDGRSRAFSVDGKVDGSTDEADLRTQLLLGHLPALLHPQARRAFVIGLGTGITAAALAAHPLEAVVVAELEPAVARAAALFAEANRDVLKDPRVHVRIGDARHLLAADPAGYDVIVSEPSNPWIAGEGTLFTREMFEVARGRLAPGGVMVQWLHAYTTSLEDVRTIAATFSGVFRHVTLWRASRADLLLVGTDRPLGIDPLALDRRLAQAPTVQADLASVLGDPGALPWTFLLSDDGVRRLAAGAPLNTYDRPILEFSAARAMYGADVDEVLRGIRAFRTDEAPFAPGARLPLFDTPGWRLHLAAVLLQQGAAEDAAEQLDRLGDPARLPVASRIERVRVLHALDRAPETLAELAALREAAPGDREVARLLARALAPAAPR